MVTGVNLPMLIKLASGVDPQPLEELATFIKEYGRRNISVASEILPDAGAYHDTFFHIDKAAVQATGLHIVPGELIGETGLFLANVDKDRNLGRRQIPFEAGLRAIMAKRPDDDPFLPVLAKGDLRELEQSWPVLHMHRVRPQVIESMSELDRTSLRNVITEKLESLFLMQGQDARVA